ncbi:hypothetical protein [Deinococcus sp. QL22]|uniref:hypothetical protein n=1 Tax=Deinococcus sp. QL22 TaxID=2939437 RepID=UPI0020173249|nr:hypothetical protein [Deinococcus sp. QL22]UQN09076.1 hypothetical protein M1R55_23800 [Deinococcus sp. QL22]
MTVSEADNIIDRHAKRRNMNPRICRSALYEDGLDTDEGLLRRDAGRYFLSTPGRGL